MCQGRIENSSMKYHARVRYFTVSRNFKENSSVWEGSTERNVIDRCYVLQLYDTRAAIFTMERLVFFYGLHSFS